MRYLFLFLLMSMSEFGESQTPESIPSQNSLKFVKKMITSENFESVAVFDIDGDQIVDLVSGGFWYKGPEYTSKNFIAEIQRFGTEYYDDFSTIPMDVNEDGYMDFITGGWWGKNLWWRENPGKGNVWTEHILAPTGNIETTRAFDLDGDGELEIIPNTPGKPLIMYKKEKGKASFKAKQITELQGHGLGFGDINNDSRVDIVLSTGWLECPKEANMPWKLHPDFSLGLAGVPIIVTDVNKDGLNDMIVGQAHDYGLDWYEQRFGKEGRKWIKHPIDPFNSQYHTMEWIDIDNDQQPELITGKRFRAHNEKDPGSFDLIGLYYFKWNGESFTKQVIAYGELGAGKGTGIFFSVFDLDKNGWPDIITAGKDGLCIFYNMGK
jgi:hypothetical protein